MASTRSRLIRLLTLGTVDLDRRAFERAQRIAEEAKWAERQAMVDPLLPAFLLGEGWPDPHPAAVGTRWLVLADLALIHHEGPCPVVTDLAPGRQDRTSRVLPRGTTLRMKGTDWIEELPYHTIAATLFTLIVEDGPLAGQTIGVYAGDRSEWRSGDPRATLVAAMIVAKGEGVTSDPAAARARYDLVVATLREAEIPTPNMVDDRWARMFPPADLAALGWPVPSGPVVRWVWSDPPTAEILGEVPDRQPLSPPAATVVA